MRKRIQCYVMALCLLITGVLGLGMPISVSAAENDDFEIMYERCYEQTIGVKPGESLDTTNTYIKTFVDNLNTTANE